MESEYYYFFFHRTHIISTLNVCEHQSLYSSVVLSYFPVIWVFVRLLVHNIVTVLVFHYDGHYANPAKPAKP